MWNDDDDEDEPKPKYKKPLAQVAPQVIVWLFVETTLRVMVPAIGFMLLGIWIGSKVGHKQGVAIVGTLIGLCVAGVLVWQQAVKNSSK